MAKYNLEILTERNITQMKKECVEQMVYYSGYSNLASTEQHYVTVTLLGVGQQPKVCFECVYYLCIYLFVLVIILNLHH